MAKKMTEKVLVKRLDTMSREELTKIIVDFYKTNKSIEEGLSLMLLGENMELHCWRNIKSNCIKYLIQRIS